VIVFFFLRNIIFRSIIVDEHATFLPDCTNVLVRVFVILGVVNCVPVAVLEVSFLEFFRARLGKFGQKSFAPLKICLPLHI